MLLVERIHSLMQRVLRSRRQSQLSRRDDWRGHGSSRHRGWLIARYGDQRCINYGARIPEQFLRMPFRFVTLGFNYNYVSSDRYLSRGPLAVDAGVIRINQLAAVSSDFHFYVRRRLVINLIDDRAADVRRSGGSGYSIDLRKCSSGKN